MDFITELPQTQGGFNTLFVVVDRFSKMVHLAPCTDETTASQAADLLVNMVFKLHGTPSSFIADRDKLWTSEFFAQWCSRLQVDLHLSSAYHPQTDGQTERMNRLLGEVLRHYIAPSHDNWDTLLPLAEFAINRAVNASTGKSPFVVVYGYQPHTPLDRFYQALTDTDVTVAAKAKARSNKETPAADEKVRDFKSEFATISRLLQAAKERQKTQYDKGRRSAPPYQVGDKVYVDTKILRVITVGTPKFLQRWQGPYEIIKVISGAVSKEVTAVKLALPVTWKVHPTFHVSAVKPYPVNSRAAPIPPTVEIHGVIEHVVEQILSHRFTGRNRRLQFLVKWAGYGTEENQWLYEEDLTSDGKIKNSRITEYWKTLSEKTGTHFSEKSKPVQEAKAMKALKYVPKHKVEKPVLAKKASKRWADAELAPSSGKRRKYNTRKKPLDG
jgi:hypothetical protein